MPAIHYEKIELPADFSLDVTEMTLEPNYDMLGRMHWHDCFEISAINGGEGTYVVDNTGYPVKSGDIVVLNNIEPHQLIVGKVPLRQIVLTFYPKLLSGGANGFSGIDYLSPFLERDADFNNKID